MPGFMPFLLERMDSTPKVDPNSQRQRVDYVL